MGIAADEGVDPTEEVAEGEGVVKVGTVEEVLLLALKDEKLECGMRKDQRIKRKIERRRRLVNHSFLFYSLHINRELIDILLAARSTSVST